MGEEGGETAVRCPPHLEVPLSLSLSALLMFGALAHAAPVVSTTSTTSTTSAVGTLVKPKAELCPKECVEDPNQSACKAYLAVCSFTVTGTQGTTLDKLIDPGGSCGNCEPPPYLRELLGLTGASGDYFTVNTVARVGKLQTEVSLVVARKGTRAAASGTGTLWLAYSGDLDRDGDVDTFAGPVTAVSGVGISAPLVKLVPPAASSRAETTGRAGGR